MALAPLPTGESKRAAVRTMFDRIAPRYDLLNRILSLGLDQRWRAATLASLEIGRGDRVVDLACGTGDLAALAAARGARVVGIDFAGGMLCRARRRGGASEFVRGDAADLPLRDRCATAVVCGFALRNFVSIPRVLEETARVLRPGGRIGLLEIRPPRRSWLRVGHDFYFERLVPRIGALLSDRAAYAYLPRSLAYLPPDTELLALLERTGFTALGRRSLGFGMTQIFTGVRA